MDIMMLRLFDIVYKKDQPYLLTISFQAGVVWWVKYNTQVNTKMLASDYSSQSEASILVSSVSMG